MPTAALPSLVQPTASGATNSQLQPHRRRQPRAPRVIQEQVDTAVQPESVTSNTGGRRNAALSLRPASLAPTSQSPRYLERTTRSPRHHGNGSAPRNQTRIVQGRQFGGSLTATELQTTIDAGLQGDAPVFQPGQQFREPRVLRTGFQQQQLKKRRLSKSQAPDIQTRIHEDIDNRQYECPICTSEVVRHSRIWSCHTCWTVFHLSCIKQWSTNAESTAAQGSPNGEAPKPRQWRCPGCNLPQDTKPSSYTCWCGKDLEPRSTTGLPPHSCGQTCGKHRNLPRKCPHPCELLCHAGPCPPCSHVGPTKSCFCGKESRTRKCIDTVYESGWGCQKICGDTMPCGEHTCPRECHEGLCGGCEVRIDGRCYCGKTKKATLCCDKDDDKTSERVYAGDNGQESKETWIGIFACSDPCDRSFDCGKHRCEKPCHSQTGLPTHCPRSPDIVMSCPCGKTDLSDITSEPRQSCEDRIPNCLKVCSKALPCGHECKQICHTGDCMPCRQTVTIHCRCGRTALSSVCHQGNVQQPQCTRVCHTTLNCGRHECGERCCAGERRAIERQNHKRKQRPLNSSARPIDDLFEAEHICTRVCGRTLKCGNHFCQELCHKGPCGSCREAIFDEVSCHCGRTVLQPPLPCGTRSPPCRFDCERVKTCGHPQVSHNCHLDDEPCPRCPFLTEKPCLCGKKTLKNQQCWFTEVRCGTICGRRLKCGSHHCCKTCHRLGECEDANGHCQQTCGKAKKACGHPCEEPCHAPYPCREETPCTHKLLITCECQHKKQEMRCNASRTSEGSTIKSLKCDDECARLERNRKLALALDIDPALRTDDHVPYAKETLDLFAEVGTKFAQEHEREFRVFADVEAEKRLRFKPMLARQRAFIHALAEDFGLDSESMDPEPHRHVAIFKTPRFVSAPMKTLRDCVRIRQTQQRAAAVEALETQAAAKKISMLVSDPSNGFLLTTPRFALTLEELHGELLTSQGPHPKLGFNVQFLATGDVALKPLPTAAIPVSASHTTLQAERTIEHLLQELKLPLTRAFASHGFGALQLCRFDDSLNVLQVDQGGDSAGGGWSQVAAKAAVAPRRAPQVAPVGSKSGFAVLGSLTAKKKKEEQAEEKRRRKREVEEAVVVDDWAAEMEREERVVARELTMMGEAPGEESDGKAGYDGVAEVVAIDAAVAVDGRAEGGKLEVPVGEDAATNGVVDAKRRSSQA